MFHVKHSAGFFSLIQNYIIENPVIPLFYQEDAMEAIALMADIHANLPAAEAVIADI